MHHAPITTTSAAIAAALILLAAPAAPAGTTSATLHALQGAPVPGRPGFTYATLNAPFTDGLGRVGFTCSITDGDFTEHGVWYDGAMVFRASDALPEIVSGAEGTMGVSDTGDFIYSPSTGGDDSVRTSAGLLLKEGDPAPGIAGQVITFTSRPTMLPDGTAHFVAGFSTGGATQGRVLYRHAGGVFTRIVTTGDLVDGVPVVSPAGVDFDYGFSRDGLRHGCTLQVQSAGTKAAVAIDGTIVALEGEATGDGDTWDNFDLISINDAGDYVFSGDTGGGATTDEFVAANGAIAIREGDVVDGVALGSGFAVLAMSVNQGGDVAHAWGLSDNDVLFVGQVGDLAGTSMRVLGTGDEIDVTGDGVADYTVLGLNPSNVVGPGLQLADDGMVRIEVELEPIGGGDGVDAIVGVAYGSTPCLGDADGSGDVGFPDLLAVLAAWGPCPFGGPCPPDFNSSGDVGFRDLLIVLSEWGPCP